MFCLLWSKKIDRQQRERSREEDYGARRRTTKTKTKKRSKEEDRQDGADVKNKNKIKVFTSVPSCLFSSLLPSSFVVCLSFCTRRRQLLSKALMYHCFLVFRRTGEYISQDLFYKLQYKHPAIQSKTKLLSRVSQKQLSLSSVRPKLSRALARDTLCYVLLFSDRTVNI